MKFEEFLITMRYPKFCLHNQSQADAPYKTLNSLMCRIVATNRDQVRLKLQLLNLIELIGSSRLGIYCLDIFEFTYEFTLTVRHLARFTLWSASIPLHMRLNVLVMLISHFSSQWDSSCWNLDRIIFYYLTRLVEERSRTISMSACRVSQNSETSQSQVSYQITSSPGSP